MTGLSTMRARGFGAIAAAVFGLVLAHGRTATATTLSVQFETEISTYTWVPLRREVIERLVRSRVLQVVTKRGELRLLGPSATEQADIVMHINGRVIEDAQQFSVYVSATPQKSDRVGSFAAVMTHSIRAMKHGQIQAQIERTAAESAKKLYALLSPQLLRLARPNDAEPPKLALKLPVDLSVKHLAGRTAKLPKDLGSFALKAQNEGRARQALATCALRGATGRRRVDCVNALERLARKHSFAQRALLALLWSDPPAREKDWPDWIAARRKAFQISTTFDGAVLREAEQAWLKIYAADWSTRGYRLFSNRREDDQLLRPIARYLEQSPDVPNLDVALAHCSQPSARGDAPGDTCLRVLKTVPVERRVALLYHQLTARPFFTTRPGKVGWGSLFRTAFDRGRPLHPLVEKVCIFRMQRSYLSRERCDCAEALARGGRATSGLLAFLVANYLSVDEDDQICTQGALADLVRRKRELCPQLEKELAWHIERGAYVDYPRAPRALHVCDDKRWDDWERAHGAR